MKTDFVVVVVVFTPDHNSKLAPLNLQEHSHRTGQCVKQFTEN
jgi:galactose-1-phosphate uridylyltransferase